MILLFSILSFFLLMFEWNVISLVFAKIGIPPDTFSLPFSSYWQAASSIYPSKGFPRKQ